MKQLLTILAMMLLVPLAAWSQRTVTGTVTDDNGQPLVGATVLVQGTSTGTVSDIDGTFSIDVPDDNSVLVVSYTGYETQTIPVGGQSTIDVTMTEGVALSEVVVTGYSTESKRQTTGAVSTVAAADLAVIPSGNVEQQLQGRAPGVTVITSGQPGTSSIIRVRGFGAFGGNEPLYVVDGVPVGNVEFLAPDDIETTTILKDAASASIYGARAANGVIVFTTKKGKQGPKPLTVFYDGLTGFTTPGEAAAILNPQEQAEWTWNAIRNTAMQLGTTPNFTHPQYGTGTTPVIPDWILVGNSAGIVGNLDLEAERARYNINPNAGPIYQVVRANKEGTDWYDEITRRAPIQRHTLGFSGAGEASRYYFSLGMQDQAGILLHQDFKRYSFRANTQFDIGSRFRIGENLQFTYRSVTGLIGDAGGRGASDDENTINDAFRIPAIIPVYDEFGGYAGTRAPGFSNPRNPVADRERSRDNQNFGTNLFGNVYAELDLLRDLTVRTSLGGQYFNFFGNGYAPRTYERSENTASYRYDEFNGYGLSWVFTNTANFRKTFGVHGFDLLAGIEALNTGAGRNVSAFGLNPFSEDIDYVNLNTVSPNGRTVGGNNFNGVNFYSVFGRLNYNFNEKYYITGVLRRDGSSRFGANSRFGTFPAVSAAWRISAEPFMQNVRWISDLKLRGGWGEMGNSNNVDPNNQFSLYASSVGNASYDIGGSNTSAAEGFYRSRIGNPDARWETSTTTNIGMDATFFGGRLDVIFDWWKKETDELLYQLPLPNVTGPFAAAPAVNIASMLNRGIDAQLIWRGKLSTDFSYEVDLTGAFLHNEITALAPGLDFFDGPNAGRLSTPATRNAVGNSISSFFGYQVVGLFQNQAEVDAAPDQEGAAPGRFRYADLNGFDENGELTGTPDGIVNAADRTFIGNPVPDFIGGLNLKLKYKGFDIEAFTYLGLGNEIFNLSRWFTDFYPSFSGAAIGRRVLNSWSPNNTNTDIPIYETTSNFSTNTVANSYYVEDGSYLRMANLTLGYNLPASAFGGAFSRARIFVGANNLFTITDYSGLDPSVGGAVDTNFGIDVGNYPITRCYNLGLGLTF